MSQIKATILLFLSLILVTFVNVAQGASVYVSADEGNDDEGTGTAGSPLKTITAAINLLAETGADNITLLPGIYTGPENTNIRVSLDSNTVRIVSEKGPTETFVGSVGDYRTFQVGGEALNGTTTVTLPYSPMNGTDDAATATVREDSWRSLIPNLVLSGLTIYGGTASKGNAVYVEGGVIKIFNSRIVKGLPGALYIKNVNSKVLVANSVFALNSPRNGTSPVLRSGGAIFMEDGSFHCDNCRFTNNTAVDHGGAVYALRGTIRLSNTNLTGNVALKGGGGAIFFSNTSGSSYVVATKFRNNQAVRGGACFVGGFSGPQFINSTFANNSASHVGGALLSIDSSRVGLKRGTFLSNTANSFGGAVAVMGNSSVLLGLSYLSQNKADSGGAVYTSGSSRLNIKQGVIVENVANNGAGLMITDTSTPLVEKTELSLNRASRGGALYCDDNSRPRFVDCRMKENFASLDGGALFAAFDTAPDFHECHFLDNTSNLGDPFTMSFGAQHQIKFTLCSVYPHPHKLDDEINGFSQQLNVL